MIDKNKTYRTRGGHEVRIYAVNGGHGDAIHGAINNGGFWKPCSWFMNGLAFSGTGTSTFDLIEVKPRIQREVWVNVYPDAIGEYTYNNKLRADLDATKGRIACVRLTIDCEEGDGL